MPGKQAKILSTDHIDDLLFFADNTRLPLRNRLIVLFGCRLLSSGLPGRPCLAFSGAAHFL
jgi:hypothetical protein